jgi:hypothetical protein
LCQETPATAGRLFVRPQKCENPPNGSQQKNECNYSEQVLVERQTVIDLRAGPGVIPAPKGRKVFDRQQRKGHQNEASAREQAAQRGDGLFIRDDNENHYQIADRLNPSFERDAREIGPENAQEAEGEIDQNRPICFEESEYSAPAMEEDEYRCDQQYAEESPIDWAAIKLDIACVSNRPAQPDLDVRTDLSRFRKKSPPIPAMYTSVASEGFILSLAERYAPARSSHHASKKSRCTSSKLRSLWMALV